MQEIIEAVETANLPSSAITKLGSFLLATGLAVIAKGDAAKISQSFVKQLYDLQDWSITRRYGIKNTWISPKPEITKGLAREIRTAITKKVTNDPTVTAEELKFIKFAVLFAGDPQRTDNAVDRARNFAAQVSQAFLRNFNKVVDRIEESGGVSTSANKRAIGDVYKELDIVMEQILGRKLKKDEKSISGDISKKFRAGNANQMELIKNYKALKRQLSVNYDMDFLKFMSGQTDLVSVYDVYQHMSKLGYRDQKVVKTAKTFPLKVGITNGKLKYYTESGKPILNGIPADAVDIKLSRTYKDADGSGSYLSYTTPTAQGVTRVYTEEHSQASGTAKFDKASNITANIDKIVGKWKADLTATDPIKQMGASVAYMIYLTGMRIGSRQNSAASTSGEKTFGAISLRPRHISVTGTSIILKYKGKKGVEQKHIIPLTGDSYAKRLAKNLEKYLKGKKGDTLVFSFVNERGTEKILSPHLFNQYIKASGYPYGIHKLRHVRGTNLVAEMLANNKWVPSAAAKGNLTKRQKEAEEWVVTKVITPATKLLGHRSGDGKNLWRTTVRSYIDPAVLREFFTSNDLRTPSWLPSKAESD